MTATSPQTLTKTPDLQERLRAFDIFHEVDDDALAWLVKQSSYVCYPKGTHIFRSGEPADHMQVLLTGSYVIQRESNGRRKELGMWKAPYVTGVLPFSRMHETGADGICLEDTKVLELHRGCFVEMVNVSYDLTQALVAVMTNRVRDFQQMRLMDEKLMALGKMSAGLAHELNNPASAIVRSSQELHKHLVQTPDRFKSVVTMRVSLEDIDRVNEVLFDRIASTEHDTEEELGLMEREERLDELLDWLEDHGVDEADRIVDTFVDWNFRTEHFEQLAAVIPEAAIQPLFWWIETNLTTESLVNEIQASSSRIAELVQSIKSYSHMDQEPSLEMVNVHEGLKSTFIMLYHAFKKKNVRIKKELGKDIPRVKALAGELNQVWTNLLSNALDALPADGSGELTLRTFQERDCVCVEFEDNGPGIPEAIQSRIFEPFFTTKGVGEGTGMGLDIVRRVIDHHNGYVNVDSEPGRTVFRVCFPIQ
ncbi:histidine kinase/DNA gyrase B/HSP90-like ATPase [Neolewinella xylanilytica]|uniref:histidine kinase n=1 Tax=Neolewinella xylanilytica TaxID=1514080 RepID=A0A2S6I243_9BACT|nr:ATP-binding protein [Neolewinella xylanilytica]PPK85247.1 histidine kinase/DNA gyrase B/HSP90-like ATPase [Neolewinella xylanilytica]